MTYRIRFIQLFICLQCACSIGVPAFCEVDPVAEMILTRQKLYCASIVSLDLHQVLTMTANEALAAVRGDSSTVDPQEGRIVLDGPRYYSEVKIHSGGNTAVSGVADIIVDNPACTLSGSWTTASSSTGKYGSDYQYCSTAASETKSAKWTPTMITGGSYDVYCWYPQGGNRSARSPYTVQWNGGSQTVNINQQANGGRWNVLVQGKPFRDGTAGYVKLANGTGETSLIVVADAVKFVYSAPDVLYSAYDGNKYQARNGSMLTISSHPLNANPYNGWTVITAPFVFAFGHDLPLSIHALRDPGLWTRLLGQVIGARKDEMLGHEGTVLEFASPDDPDKKTEAFFADDLNQLPVYVKISSKDTISEMTVLATKTVQTDDLDLVVPIRVKAKDYSVDEAYVQDGIIEAQGDSLQINMPVDQSVFTLPKTNVRLINYADYDLLIPVTSSKQ